VARGAAAYRSADAARATPSNAKRDAFQKRLQAAAQAYQEFQRANKTANLLGAGLPGVGVIGVKPSEIENLEVVESQRYRVGMLEVGLLFERMAQVDEPVSPYDRPVNAFGEPNWGVPDRVVNAFTHAQQVGRAWEEKGDANDDLRHHPLVEREKAEADAEHAALIEARDRELAGGS
jgi:hypothetical protein